MAQENESRLLDPIEESNSKENTPRTKFEDKFYAASKKCRKQKLYGMSN
jgi:hypothetical protein